AACPPDRGAAVPAGRAAGRRAGSGPAAGVRLREPARAGPGGARPGGAGRGPPRRPPPRRSGVRGCPGRPRHAPGALAGHLITSAAPGSRLPVSAAATIARRSRAPSRGAAFLRRGTLPTTATPCRRVPAHDDRFAGFPVVIVNVAAVVILSVGQHQ